MLALVLASLIAVAATAPSPASQPTPMTINLPAPEQTTAPAPEALSAGKIFANARLAMYLRTYPRFITYVIDIQATTAGDHYHEGYRALMRTYDGALAVKQTPIYTTNQAPDPYGFSFFGLFKSGNPRSHIDPPFGVPLMSATYDFGLAEAPVSNTNLGPREAAIAALSPPVIGHVAVTGGDYDVSLLGEEDLGGSPVYHLSLRPLHDPDLNRIRELWVDTQTFDVRKLVTQGIFTDGPATKAPWIVSFIQLHGYWFIRTETTAAPLRAGGHLFASGVLYRGVTYTFGDYAYPGLISDLEFVQPRIKTGAIQF
jgi:hypothetical protein